MTQQTLYQECPLCSQAVVELQADNHYRCAACGLTLKEQAVMGIFKKEHYSITSLGHADFSLAEAGLKDVALKSAPLKITLGNIYPDDQLAEIASGNIELISPVKTVLAQIILEQLKEECFINVRNLRRGHGQPINEESWYQPTQKISTQSIDWQNKGNLFCTSKRLVLPSEKTTFIRIDRKVSAVQAFTDGFALQRKNEAFATYFGGCYPHAAALVAAYVMGRVPMLRS